MAVRSYWRAAWQAHISKGDYLGYCQFYFRGFGGRCHVCDVDPCPAFPVKSGRDRLLMLMIVASRLLILMIVASGTVLCHLLLFGPGYLRNCPSLCVVMQILAGNFQGEPSAVFSTLENYVYLRGT